MRGLLIVGCGGFIGAAMRYLIGGGVHRLLDQSLFPYGTLAVNLIGCLAIGLLGGLSDSRQMFSAELRMFLFVGVLGGFTTFSAFGYETVNLLRDGQLVPATLNVFLQLGLGLIAVWLGLIISRYL